MRIQAYNRKGNICNAIESVLNQNMDNIEVLVVDNGSTDNTRGKLKTYEGKIKYIHAKNVIPAHALNVGMVNAKGEYISFLDSDVLLGKTHSFSWY